jgi:aspartyl-tRNA(Asn)/glutamyl-tRNA(Gln) amidotransferase subunit A
MPCGLQIVGKAFDEMTVLKAGRAIEHAADFTASPHPWWSGP